MQPEINPYAPGSGLNPPELVGRQAEIDAFDLFNYREIGALDASSSRDALLVPAGRLGVEFDTDAMTEIVQASGGYPYFLQTYGQAAWDIAEEKIVRLSDAKSAVIEGNAALLA
jgi:hypothetical protein